MYVRAMSPSINSGCAVANAACLDARVLAGGFKFLVVESV